MTSRVNEVVSGIGLKLKALRKARGYSLQALADRANVSAAAIHKIESNSMVPTISTLLKIAAALDKPVAYFVEEDEELAPTVKVEADMARAAGIPVEVSCSPGDRRAFPVDAGKGAPPSKS